MCPTQSTGGIKKIKPRLITHGRKAKVILLDFWMLLESNAHPWICSQREYHPLYLFPFHRPVTYNKGYNSSKWAFWSFPQTPWRQKETYSLTHTRIAKREKWNRVKKERNLLKKSHCLGENLTELSFIQGGKRKTCKLYWKLIGRDLSPEEKKKNPEREVVRGKDKENPWHWENMAGLGRPWSRNKQCVWVKTWRLY